MRKTLLAFFLTVSMTLCLSLPVLASGSGDSGDIVILHTNDVHCGIEDNIGYAGLASYVKEMESLYGKDRVTLVDAGDALQGDVIGTLSRGEWLVDILNELGYDIFVPGNHEFDYGMDQMQKLMRSMDATVLSCNFVDLETSQPVFDGYTIIDYGTAKIGYVGITTPETFSKSTPVYFQNEKGEYIYSLCERNQGADLYDAVQASVDAAIREGADYIVAVGHLGETSITDEWKASAVISHTTGIDVLIDGHSHEQILKTVPNQNGEDVLWSQTGTKLASIGKIVIHPETGEITHELVTDYDKQDEDTKGFLDGIRSEYTQLEETVVAESEYTLTANDPETGNRAIRNAETNLGDFCADAYRFMLGADIAFVNGGGIRADLPAGAVTYGNIIEVHPYSNELCMVEATGQEILDALEMGAKNYPYESGGFLQVSGLTYTIDPSVPSSVITNEQGEFLKVDGAYRVKDVSVGEEALDLEKTYTLASHNYMLKDGGDGMTMFKDNPLILDCVMIDNQALIDYMTKRLGAVVGEAYADPCGQGRITILSWPADVPGDAWYSDAVSYVWGSGIMTGSDGLTFAPGNTVSRGMVFQTLYQISGSPETDSAFCTFGDIQGKWYETAAAWAQEAGICSGLEDQRFAGDQPVTRQEIAKIMTDFAGTQGVTLTASDYSGFHDAQDVAAWCRDAMSLAVGSGLIAGSDETLDPSGTATRAQLAQILMNYHQLQSDEHAA